MTANQKSRGSDRYQLLTVEEAAEMLRQHPKTVYRRVSDGELPWVNIAPKGKRAIIRFRLDQITGYIEDSGNAATKPYRRAA